MVRREQVLGKLPVRPEHFVVEVGPGQIPYQHTKLILDKFPFRNAERTDDILNVAPIVAADAHRLPLQAASCDVLFLSHVIEHLADPWAFLEEARRTARHVYLEFPSLVRELMYAWPYHRWFVRKEGKRLWFHANDVPQQFGAYFHEQYDLPLDVWSKERFEQLNTWIFADPAELEFVRDERSAMEYVAELSPRDDDKLDHCGPYALEGLGCVRYSLAARFKLLAWCLIPEVLLRRRALRARSRNRSLRQGLTPELIAKLQCPACRSGTFQLDDAKRELCCASCNERFPERRGVFDLDREPYSAST